MINDLILANDPFIIEDKLTFLKLLCIYAHHERPQYLVVQKKFVYIENGVENIVITPLIYSDNDE